MRRRQLFAFWLLMCWLSPTLAIVDTERNYESYFEEDYCNLTVATAASRRFSYTMLKTASSLVAPRRNMLLTPLSVGMSLAMISYGASGLTKSQIFSTLEQRDDGDPLEPECLLRAYHADIYNYQFVIKEGNTPIITKGQIALLRTGTRLFGERTYVFRDEFVQSTGNFGAEMDVANFKTSPTIARKKINAWVSDQTDGSIQEIFREGSISRSAALAISCVLFFKGGWQTPFTNNTPRPFYHYHKRYRTVDYMTLDAPFRYTFSSRINARMVEIPYASPDGSNVDARLILILPNKTSELRNVEESLSDEDILPFLHSEPSDQVELHIPKFALSGYHKMKFFLKRMGVREVFSVNNARLPGLAFQHSKQKRLFLSHIQHKSNFQVNEYGTHVDSLSTNQQPASANSDRKTPVTLKQRIYFDRPFVFLIYEKFSEKIVFMGRYSDPLRRVS